MPLMARPSLRASCVKFTRHSRPDFCGRTIAPLRGNCLPAAAAFSISMGMVRHASPALSGSMPLRRNIIEG